ncbi:hypothetical protein ABL78_7140 [Leptomonas seymouri]|uniref:Autophagy-related protein 2 n=1 Tax=Leptomonas seymouri TaxID=5684 RepID=A0A0N1HUF1_LEPSE|nr:hypothetical protein ABL78_7140 [Leptomonas seymouri]|eukprot:KPI83818.1 hypothetical protein ABL78_7140 [Leptomonas seymouri]
MNLVNTYLLLPFQRKIFKNFGHYNYQTCTFHLNEERVNEVLFDPGFNPFVDILRETSHASAIASSKSAVQRRSSLSTNPHASATEQETEAGSNRAQPSPATQAEDAYYTDAGSSNTGETHTSNRTSSQTRNTVPTSSQQPLPRVQLLEGKVRSAGLVSFLRQMTTQKSLSIELIDMVFSVATATGEEQNDAGTDCLSATAPPKVALQSSAETRSSSNKSLSADEASDTDAASKTSPRRRDLEESKTVATIARSHSLADQYALFDQQQLPGLLPNASAEAMGHAQSALPHEHPAATPGLASSSFQTVGDLMGYLKNQLQGLTISVDEVRLTFCVPPAGASCSAATSDQPQSALPTGQRPPWQPSAKTPMISRGTRVVHFACRQGLRFTVDEATGAAVQDMQCSTVINDWQCYLHVMEEDGPVTTTFSLDELVMTTTAHVGAASATATEKGVGTPAETRSEESAPITVRVARQGASALPKGHTSSLSVETPPKILLDVEASGGWSVVLTASQVAHLADMVHLVNGARTVGAARVLTEEDASAGAACENASSDASADGMARPTPSLSRRAVDTTDALSREVDAAPLESGEAVTAAVLAATQLRVAVKYFCVHSAGCSVTLLTQPVLDHGVVARAWSGALPPQQLLLLRTSGDRQEETADVPSSRRPVFDALASPHFTYVMRDVDILFPNIEFSTTPSAVLSHVFAANRKKRSIYRNLFKNHIADPAVTERLACAQQRGIYDSAQTFFLGIGSIALMEYRQAVTERPSENGASHKAHRILRPAELLRAERSPYALVVLHRFTQPLLEKTVASSLPNSDSAPQTSPAPSLAAPPQLRAHDETIVVGLASIAVLLDPELLEVLTTYFMTLARLIQSMSRPEVPEESSPKAASQTASPTPPSMQRTSAAMIQAVGNQSSIKVLLETLEASVRFPLYPQTVLCRSAADLPDSSPSISPATPPAALPSLLARLLQRLRETSLNTHRQLRAGLVQLARPPSDGSGTARSGQNEPAACRVSTDESHAAAKPLTADKARSLLSIQEKLGFPEDVYGKARFLPETLRFSIRDLQVVQTQSSCGAVGQSESDTAIASLLHEPFCTSVKWRGAVVYMHDVLEDTKSELFRGDYTPDMGIRVTHTRLPDEAALSRWQALRHVLTLQIRLGEVTTTVLTQDDFLLASYYVQELLQTLAHCRQRMRGFLGEAMVTADAQRIRSTGAGENVLNAAPTTMAVRESKGGKAGSAGADAPPFRDAQQGTTDVMQDSDLGSGWPLHSSGSAGSTVAEAFAIADAHKAAEGAAQCATIPLLHNASELLSLAPVLWCSVESTCTALNMQIGRVRVGLFAPRLSPMGEVVGEPLFRCLPAAQRRQMVDMNCLYHTYIAEVVGVSVRALVGNGALVGKGQGMYLRARFDGFSLWEHQPLALPVSGSEHGRGAGTSSAAAAASSSLYSSYVSGVMHPSSTSPSSRAAADMMQRPSTITSRGSSSGKYRSTDAGTGSVSGTCRDISYYLSNQQHRGTMLVQLIQSYTEVSTTSEDERAEENQQFLDASRGYRGMNGALRRDERFLYQLWSCYLQELSTRLSEGAHSATEKVNIKFADPDVGVCEVCLLEYMTGEEEAPTQPSVDSHALRDTRLVTMQLTGLGLHHTVAYNGDYLAAVLKSYFSGGDAMIPTTEADAAALFAEQAAEPAKSSRADKKISTVIHLELNNLMATYRPRGVGRSLAVVLLPRASVLVNAPAWTLSPSREGAGKHAKGDAAAESAAQLPLSTEVQAWLHTSVPIYVCNDCDVEVLAREVLDPTESNDWGVDLEGAGFVRLCELISTAPLMADKDDFSAQRQHWQVKRRPNLTVTLPPPIALTTAAAALHDDKLSCNNANSTAGCEEGPTAGRESAVAVRVRYVELSAFMAKDTFDVFCELVETWGAGTDLQLLDTPAALVMRSGPGFEWVAGEVARSCAPMTFQLNPVLASTLGRERSRQACFGRGESGAQPMTGAEGAASAAGYSSRSHGSSPPSVLQRSYTSSSSQLGVQDSMLFAGSAGAAASADVSLTLETYGYNRWRDALHTAQGRDQRLCDAYQARVSELLSSKSPWVPVRRFTPQDAFAAAAATSAPQLPRSPTSQRGAATFHITSFSSCEDGNEEGTAELDVAAPLRHAGNGANVTNLHSPTSAAPPPAALGVSSLSSSFSDLSDLETSFAPLQWRVMPSTEPNTTFSETLRRIPAAALVRGSDANVPVELNSVDGADVSCGFDLCAACERLPHFLSCWSRDRVDASSQNCPISLSRLERTDDTLLHDTAEKYLYPPVELQLFLCDCAFNVSLYEGADLMAAAVRKQRQGYLQIVSRGARVAQAAVPYTMDGEHDRHWKYASGMRGEYDGAGVGATGRDERLLPAASRSSRAATTTATTFSYPWKSSSESSASRLSRLSHRGCRSGFGDRDASKRLVLVCRGITVQLNTFPQASEEDLWFHIVVGEATVFDCIETSDVHRLLTATPQSTSASTAFSAAASGAAANDDHRRARARGARGSCVQDDGSKTSVRQLVLTGLLTSSKSIHMTAARHEVADDARVSFTVSHFQQGGSELSLVVRMQPTSLTWSGASVDFAQSFFASSSASTSPSPAPPGGSDKATGVHTGARDASLRACMYGAADSAATASASADIAAADADDGIISGTEAPPIFFRRIVILPTTLTIAGSFQSDKGVIAALAEGKSLDALRSIPVLSWISVQEIPLPIPFMRIEDCSSAATLLQRIVEDSNCMSIRFILTALCCGLQPLSAVARVGEAAKGLLLLPLSQYRGAALHHAIRTASSLFMQELLTQTSGVAALLASGSYHASRSLLEVLVPPSDRRLAVTAEPSRASQPAGLGDGWRQGQEQLRTGLDEALSMASYCTGPDGSLLRLPAAALRMLMGVSGAATATLWGVRNSQGSATRDRDGYIYKK